MAELGGFGNAAGLTTAGSLVPHGDSFKGSSSPSPPPGLYDRRPPFIDDAGDGNLLFPRRPDAGHAVVLVVEFFFNK